MKNFILFTIAVMFLSVSSCQDETEIRAQDPNSLTKVARLSVLTSRVTQNPTHSDNCIDGTSCYSVVLPVTITVNNQPMTVNSYDDYTNVKAVINQYSTDDDIVHFTFPITLKYPNFQEITVNNQTQLNAIRQACGPEPDFYEISCIHFNYPLVINSYNSTSQVAYTTTVTSDAQFYNFIFGLKEAEIYSLKYPITMSNSNGELLVFNNNVALQSGIENTIDDCDDESSVTLVFPEIITAGTWHVSSYLDNTHDETYHYSGYNFAFSSNGNVVATISGTSSNGTWSTTLNNGNQTLNLNFAGSNLHDLNRGWIIIEFNATTVRLRHQEDEGESEVHYLNLVKN